MRGSRILVVGISVAVLGVFWAAPALADDPMGRLSGNVAREWTTWNRGGAPVSAEFVQVSLEQGLTVADVQRIFESQALGGPQTSASFSSPELLDHFTDHPEQIPELLSAVRSVAGAPTSYAAYLTAGGVAGAVYRSYDQLLQAAVLALPGALDAYMGGTSDVSALARIQQMSGAQDAAPSGAPVKP